MYDDDDHKPCDLCDGRGGDGSADDDSVWVPCEHCKGRGVVVDDQLIADD